MKRKYFFLHIPKTAGSSLFSVFNKILGPENIKQVDDIRNFGLKQARLLRKYKLVGGHFVYPHRLLFEEDRYTMIFLRNPVDRFLSQYFYFREKSFCKVASGHDLAGYIDFFKDQKCGGVMNAHIWHLTGRIDTTLSVNELLEIARENLAKFDFVGISEFFADSLDLLCYDCNWPPVEEIPVENVTGERPGVWQIDEKIIDRIRESNSYDMKLYEYGLELFSRKKRSVMQECIIKKMAGAEVPCSIGVYSPEKADSQTETPPPPEKPANFGSYEVQIISAGVFDDSGLPEVKSGGNAVVRVVFRSSISAGDITLGFNFEDEYRQNIYGTNSHHLGMKFRAEEGKTYRAEFRLRMDIGEGRYKLNVSLHTGPDHLERCFHWWEHAGEFTVTGYEEPYCVGIAKLYPGIEVNQVHIIDRL